MKDISDEFIRRFRYSNTSPTYLVWAENVFRGADECRSVLRRIGDKAGYIGSDGYARVRAVCAGTVLIHRIIWRIFFGEIPSDCYVDHIDGNRSNNDPSNLRAVVRNINARNIKKMASNKSGVTGVSYDDKGRGRYYWKAKWNTTDGKPASKAFSINTLGDAEAFRLACEHRAKMIDEMNKQGAGYTERHGI